MRVTVLGCGNSSGVPTIGCDCAVCHSVNPKNKRSRVSVLVEDQEVALLIDSSPDLRQQALNNNINKIDAVLYTHSHADHANGIDDLRVFSYRSGKPLPLYANAKTLSDLTTRFSYIFSEKTAYAPYKAWVDPHIIPDEAIHYFKISGITVCSFEQLHAKIKTIGYRIGNFAYSTDVKSLPETAFTAMEGLDVWLVDCLKYKESFSHSHLSQTLEWIERVKPKLAILTHMSHDLEYEDLSGQLPAGVVAAYDGMVVEL